MGPYSVKSQILSYIASVGYMSFEFKLAVISMITAEVAGIGTSING